VAQKIKIAAYRDRLAVELRDIGTDRGKAFRHQPPVGEEVEPHSKAKPVVRIRRASDDLVQQAQSGRPGSLARRALEALQRAPHELKQVGKSVRRGLGRGGAG
jgi:hypothetical protein